MRRLAVIALISLASLSLTGCAFFNSLFNRGEDAAQPESTATPAPEKPKEPAQEEFTKPMVPAAPSASAIASAELIQSTDPNERLQQIQKSRPDPYATLPIPPKPKPAPPAPPAGTQPKPPGGGGTATAGGGGSTLPQQPGGPGSLPGVSPIQPLPELPKPEIATAVAVTGVIQINGDTFAIVKAPGEATSRYVREGQRLANGRVLVKRIQVRGGEEPVVILEENGIEVARAVGSSTEDIEETAAIPSPAQAIAVPPFPQS